MEVSLEGARKSLSLPNLNRISCLSTLYKIILWLVIMNDNENDDEERDDGGPQCEERNAR